MNIIIGKNSGFCAGVRNSVAKTEEELKNANCSIDCLGELIHNKQVIESLENKGLNIISSINEAKNKVIIRAHGVSKSVYQFAKDNNINLIDLTCPKVLKIHSQVQEFSQNNYFIFLFGLKNHPETIGTFSFCGNNSYLLESLDDILPALEQFKNSGYKDLLIISQTTFSLKLFDEMCSAILNYLDSSYNIHIEKSICNATNLRQLEAKELSTKVDLMIIIGGKNSSNTKKLYEVATENCKNVLYVQTSDDLDLNFVKKFEHIGIMAGASTPEYIINDVYNAIKL